ncbi:MAG: LysE family transporter [Pseudomonadota bacterium]
MTLPIEIWAVFLISAYGVSIYPGPNNILALSNGSRFGVRASCVAGCLGRLPAFAIQIGLTAIGLGALLAASETAFTVLKYLGAAYLVYLGLRMIFAAVDVDAEAAAIDTAADGRIGVLARRDFFTAISNPKSILLFTAFFPQFVDPTQPAIPQFAMLGAPFLVLEATAIWAYAAGGDRLKRLMRSPRSRTWLNRATGGALIGAAGLLAVSERPA